MKHTHTSMLSRQVTGRRNRAARLTAIILLTVVGSLNRTGFTAQSNTISLSGSLSSYGISSSPAADGASQTLTITDLRPGSPDGTAIYNGIEVIQFADRTARVVGAGSDYTLPGAYAAALEGELILMARGTYSLPAVSGSSGSGGLNLGKANLEVRGVSRDDVIINVAGANTNREHAVLRVSATGVTVRSLTINGWATETVTATAGNGYLVWLNGTSANNTTFNTVKFVNKNIRVSIYNGTANGLNVTNCRFEGHLYRYGIRGAGTGMNITNNIFDLRFYGSGTDLSGLLTFEYGAPTSGTISGNSFTHGVGVTVTSSDAVGQFSSQSLFPAITNFQPGSITSSGLSITNNAFKFANASQTNTSTGFTGRPAAIYNIQGVQATGPITITGNSFEGYGYLATGASVPEVVSTTDPGRGHVIEFDGIQDHGTFTMPANIGAQGSVSVWIRPTDVGSTRRAVFNGGGVEITVRNGTIYFYPNSGSGESSLTYAVNNSFTANTWTHVIVTWNFASKDTQIYFNNVVASYQSSYAPPRSNWMVAADTAGKLVHIGRDPANPGREFPGRMDDVAVFSSVLTPQQRADLFSGTGLNTTSIPSLVAYWSPSAGDIGKTSIAGSGGTSTTLTLSSPVSAPHNFIDVTGGTSPVNISGNSYTAGTGILAARISGSTADDTLYGTPGDDTISGLAGNDILAGSTGTNTVTGGPGTDAAWFTGNNTDYAITGNSVKSNPGITPFTNTLLVDIENIQYDNEAPTATISYSEPATGEVTTSMVKYLVTFSKEVTGVSVSNFSLDSAADSTASPPFLFPHPSAVITAITGSGTTRQVTISLGSVTGQIRLRLANGIGIADNVGALVANIPVVSPVYNRPLVVADVPEGGVPGGGGSSAIIPVTTDDTKTVTAPLTNLNPFPVIATYSANISQGLEAANCIGAVSNVPRGTCSINNAARMDGNSSLFRKLARSQAVQTLVWSGTLQAGETVIINYQVTVTATQQSNSLLITSTGQFINLATGLVVANLPAIILSYAVSVTPAGPGAAVSDLSLVNAQIPGSVLFYNLYTSAVNSSQEDTRLTLTNINQSRPVYVHLFFVDGVTCAVADNIALLTANQTLSFQASEIDPMVRGYLIAVAIDETGCPISFNWLAGGAYVRLASGHLANLSALGVRAGVGLAPCPGGAVTADLRFNGVNFESLPRMLAVSNIQSPAAGNDTILVINRIGGNATTGMSRLGTIFGLLFDDQERPASFTAPGEGCQLVRSLGNTFPRVVPRYDQMVPAGRSGWIKLYVASDDQAIAGSLINRSQVTGGFNGGHNLHLMTTTSNAILTIPVIPVS